MQFFVKTLDGKIIELDVDLDKDTVGDVVEKIAKKEGIPFEYISLIISGQCYAVHSLPLWSIGVSSGSTFYLVLRFPSLLDNQDQAAIHSVIKLYSQEKIAPILKSQLYFQAERNNMTLLIEWCIQLKIQSDKEHKEFNPTRHYHDTLFRQINEIGKARNTQVNDAYFQLILSLSGLVFL